MEDINHHDSGMRKTKKYQTHSRPAKQKSKSQMRFSLPDSEPLKLSGGMPRPCDIR